MSRRVICYHGDHCKFHWFIFHTKFFLNHHPLTDEGTGPPGSTPPPHSSDGHHMHHQMPSHILLSELPEPPIPVSEIGPIPPPPMFSTPSPTMMTSRQQHGPILPSYSAAQQQLQQQQQQQVVWYISNRVLKCVLFLPFHYNSNNISICYSNRWIIMTMTMTVSRTKSLYCTPCNTTLVIVIEDRSV